MKGWALSVALASAIAIVAAPAAEAAARKGKAAQKPRPPVAVKDPAAVYDIDGSTILARDPDPFIRLMIQRDPKPWEHSS